MLSVLCLNCSKLLKAAFIILVFIAFYLIVFGNKTYFELKKETITSFSEKTIFFVETLRLKNKTMKLTPRQTCGVESAALHNPDWDIVILTIDTDDFSEDSRETKILRRYSNVRIINMTLSEVANGTPGKDFADKDEFKKSEFKVTHTSDFVKILLLYKYGGMILDFDTIILKSVNTLPSNFVVNVYNHHISNAIFYFLKTDFARWLLGQYIEWFAGNYKPKKRFYNGHEQTTTVFKKACLDNDLDQSSLDGKQCYDYQILPSKTFFPIKWDNPDSFFVDVDLLKNLEMIKDSYGIHYFNADTIMKMSKKGVGLLEKLSKEHCPKTYGQTDILFG